MLQRQRTNSVKVEVTLRLTVSQSVSLGIEPHLGLVTRYLFFFLQLRVCFLWGALSDERTGLSFVYAAGSCQRSLCRVRIPRYSRPYFTVSSLFVAS
jgi:positive regulator of sigma E activity